MNVRFPRSVLLACLTLATLVFSAGWMTRSSIHSWTLNADGLSAGLQETWQEDWRILATADRGWLCFGYRGHTKPKWLEDWRCGGCGAVPFDGLTREWSCNDAGKLGWPVPMAGQWRMRWRVEDEVADWVICRDSGVSTEIFNVREHPQWLRARMATDVWATPGQMCKHVVAWGAVPFWALTLVTGTIPALSVARWVRRRCTRSKRNGCSKCGYDLTGNVSGVCPECGSPVVNTLPHDMPGQATQEPRKGSRCHVF